MDAQKVVREGLSYSLPLFLQGPTRTEFTACDPAVF